MRLRAELLLALLCPFTLAAEWRPIDNGDLALKHSKTDPNADAQALFREVKVSSEQHGVSYPTTIYSEYVRLKIFTDRGKEFANVQVPYFRDSNVFDVQGRTIHPDGSIVELTKSSIFDKVLERRGYKTKVISFALPAVEPGSIIEYRYSKSEGETISRYRQLEVQSAFPVDEVTFFIKPISNRYVSYPNMRLMPFGCIPERGTPTREGFEVVKVKNVPAFHEEPYSPPEYSARQWILIYYEENSNSGKDKYWSSLGKERYHEYSEQVKINGEVKQLAAQLTAGAATDEAKLDKLLAYCRTELKDTRGDEITTAEMDKAKANHSSIDTIRRKEGSDSDILYAFIALAQAAGFDARRADLSDRATFLFGPNMQSAYFLNAFDVAVDVNGKWKFYDVTNKAVPGGQLRWQEQGVYGLITGPKEPEMIRTPMLTAQDNSKNRLATLTLSEDGTLEGDVRELLFGNNASVWRERNRNTNATQREEELKDELKHRFADFEATKISITASPDASKPVGITYHLVVKNYAQRTGKRFFIQPNYFEAGYGGRFTETTRFNNVYFDYPWSESDSIDLQLPAGFELDHADAPAGINSANTCTYGVKISIDTAKNVLHYRRAMTFGDKDILIYEAKIYPAVKKLFDTMHEADNHILTLKAVAATAPVQQ
jgi:hypothetical protein